MQKVLGFAAITVLLLGSISCTQTSQKQSDSTPAVATATATPATPTPPSSPSAPTTAAVKASSFKWTDEASGTAVTTIKVGGTVNWTVAPGAPHSLEKVAGTVENGCGDLDDPFNSALTPGQPVSRTFTKVGIFGYHCGIHKGVPNCKTPPGNATGTNMPAVIKVVP